MNPLKARDLVEEFARKHGIPHEDAEIIINAYWRELKDNLKGLEHVKIQVTGLGVFRMSERKIEANAKKHKVFRKGYRKITPILIAKNEEKIRMLDRAWEKIMEYRQLLWSKQAQKKEYKQSLKQQDELAGHKDQTGDSLEEPGTDS